MMGFFLFFVGLKKFFLRDILMVLVVLVNSVSKRRGAVAYFLKKTPLKGRTYLAIYESFYSHDKKGTAHKCFKSLGSIETHKENGIIDPVSYHQNEVEALNKKRDGEGVRK